MFKCSKCIFYNEEGYRDMGFHIPECRLILYEENVKKQNKQKYDLFKSLIQYDLQAEECDYYTTTDEVVTIIKNLKNKGDNL